jgi:hypothetical protein
MGLRGGSNKSWPSLGPVPQDSQTLPSIGSACHYSQGVTDSPALAPGGLHPITHW